MSTGTERKWRDYSHRTGRREASAEGTQPCSVMKVGKLNEVKSLQPSNPGGCRREYGVNSCCFLDDFVIGDSILVSLTCRYSFSGSKQHVYIINITMINFNEACNTRLLCTAVVSCNAS
jgi:hypothetical protein